MRKFAEYIAFGFFAVIALVIVFVNAGAKGKATGGTQTAQILNAAGSATSNVAKALEGNA